MFKCLKEKMGIMREVHVQYQQKSENYKKE